MVKYSTINFWMALGGRHHRGMVAGRPPPPEKQANNLQTPNRKHAFANRGVHGWFTGSLTFCSHRCLESFDCLRVWSYSSSFRGRIS